MNQLQEESTISVPGGSLHYVTRGSGPVLLLVAGGHGDATKTHALAEYLADAFTVVTYDRRGLSSSVTDRPARSVAVHADDAARVLEAVAPEPAYVYGTSFGGLVALSLAARHPRRVDVLVAHEPPVLDLLPDAERHRARADLRNVEETFLADGVDAALRAFARFADIDPTDSEPDVEHAARSEQETRNFEFLARHDLRLIRSHALDLAELRASSARVVPAVGASSGHIWPNACGRLLAESLDVGYEVLPGGHNGYVFRPRETADRLRGLLTGRQSPVTPSTHSRIRSA